MVYLFWREVATPQFSSKDGGSPLFGCSQLLIHYIHNCPPSVSFQRHQASSIGNGIENHRAHSSRGRSTSKFHFDIELGSRSRRSPLFRSILCRCPQRPWQRNLSCLSARFSTYFFAGGFGATEGNSSSGNVRTEEQGYGCARYGKYMYVYICVIAVDIATGYGLDDREVEVRVMIRSRIFTSPPRPNWLLACQDCYLKFKGYSFPGGKAVEAGS
jgi:hypothetical protein